jgi:hypothetical protein
VKLGNGILFSVSGRWTIYRAVLLFSRRLTCGQDSPIALATLTTSTFINFGRQWNPARSHSFRGEIAFFRNGTAKTDGRRLFWVFTEIRFAGSVGQSTTVSGNQCSTTKTNTANTSPQFRV